MILYWFYFNELSIVTSLYSDDVILVLFLRIIKQDNKKEYLVTEDWSQSTFPRHRKKTTRGTNKFKQYNTFTITDIRREIVHDGNMPILY